jgi:hypothetical protein
MKINITNRKGCRRTYGNESGCGITPLMATGLGLSAAGTGMGIAASEQEKAAMNKVLEQEQAAMRGYTQKMQPVFQQHLAQSAPEAATQQMQTGTQQALAEFGKMSGAPAPASSATPTLSNAIVGDTGRARASLFGQAAAPLAGLTDYQTQQAINALRAQTQLGQIGEFAKSRASLLPAQLQQAQTSEAGLAGLGSLLGSVGGLVGLYGALNPAVADAGALSPTDYRTFM